MQCGLKDSQNSYVGQIQGLFQAEDLRPSLVITVVVSPVWCYWAWGAGMLILFIECQTDQGYQDRLGEQTKYNKHWAVF